MGPIGSSNVVKCFIEADGFKVDLKCIWSGFLEYRLWSDLELARLEQWKKNEIRASNTKRISALGPTGNADLLKSPDTFTIIQARAVATVPPF